MTRLALHPDQSARTERIDELLGITGKPERRALRVEDIDALVAGRIAEDIDDHAVPPAGMAGSQMILRPATGGIIGNADAAALSVEAGASDAERIAPFFAPFDMTIDQVYLSVGIALAASQAKVTAYAADPFCRPAALIFESANISGAAMATVAAAANFTMKAGRVYWIGARYSAAVTLRVPQPYGAPIGWTSAATPAPLTCLQRTLAFATPATPWGYAEAQQNTNRAPLVLMRIA